MAEKRTTTGATAATELFVAQQTSLAIPTELSGAPEQLLRGIGEGNCYRALPTAIVTEHCPDAPQLRRATTDALGETFEMRVRAVVPAFLETGAEDSEPLYDIMGNTAISLPKKWPLARPQLATREARRERSELRLGFAWAIQREQHARGLPVLPPCSWCGQPTGGYCDFCTKTPANPICSACGGTSADIMAACRQHEVHLSKMMSV